MEALVALLYNRWLLFVRVRGYLRRPMKLIRGLHNLKALPHACVATIGNFDGVHLGHRVIIEQVKTKALELQCASVVMVFEPQPMEYFRPEESPPRLMRFREKLEAFRNLGVDYVVCLQFNPRLRNLSAKDFILQVLSDGLSLQHLVVGDDFRFGCDRSGDYELLKSEGARLGFSVAPTETIEFENERISSTRIRECLDGNQFDVAERLLGHPYSITGCVVHGQKLGRQLGVPTANISLGRKRPALKGVYAVEAGLPDGRFVPGVANIGVKPTVDGLKPSLEVHLLSVNGDFYGQHMKVIFKKRLRDEKRFESIDALKEQIYQDIKSAKAFFGLDD